ncbi:DUF5803 family protein [Halopelagius longus]|uniref:Uncharacterized protein n=1 Tax=Halopelagius longus TaxID=1236180 RepID=A0A1H1BHW9_9EURY|nr:DUF5803 family protein [Halopelagius longus]RDI70794.1 hypothetical protein DWB78_03085 [Halopelagius longus]SDQ51568.1 hypothetical protein SAMN05216278_1805 [Halopelagius longus]
MNRRLLLAGVALAVLAVTAGCLGIGTGDVPAERIDAAPQSDYAWDSNVTTHITIQKNADFRAVYEMNRSEIELFRRDGFGGRNPLSVEAVRYRYPNGTVINGTEIRERGGEVSQTRSVTTVRLPNDAPANGGGQLAFTSSGSPKRFSLPTYVEGSYEVVLPENRHVEFPVFGSVNPPADEQTTTDDGRVRLHWTEVTTDTVAVQYYLQRDLYIFAGILSVLAVVGIGGLLYYRRQIESLKEKRQELGLDVEEDDDVGGGPPPGMK